MKRVYILYNVDAVRVEKISTLSIELLTHAYDNQGRWKLTVVDVGSVGARDLWTNVRK